MLAHGGSVDVEFNAALGKVAFTLRLPRGAAR